MILENLKESEYEKYLKAVKMHNDLEMKHWERVNKSRNNSRVKVKVKRGVDSHEVNKNA